MNTLKQIGMGLVLISTLAMTGCSDLDDPDDSNTSGGGKTNTTQTGIFVDAPVMGLHYKTDSQDVIQMKKVHLSTKMEKELNFS